MAISSNSSGTQAATIDTEHTLATITTAGTYVLSLDIDAMDLGDVLVVKVKSKVGSSGTTRLAYVGTYSNIPVEPVVFSVPIPTLNEVVFTIEQTEGTGRSYPWEVVQL